jgi:hypothetical protein
VRSFKFIIKAGYDFTKSLLELLLPKCLVLVPLSKSFTVVHNWIMSLLMNFIVNNNLENDVEK